jgi:hypothetical protein
VNQPLLVFWDESASSHLKTALQDGLGSLYETTTSPVSADAILFSNDTPSYVSRNPHYRAHRAKCIVISETDNPSYFIPAIYAGNYRSLLHKNRSLTASYFVNQSEVPNQSLKHFIDKDFEKKYLYSFRGGSTCFLRKRLFKILKSREDTLIEPTDSYQHWFWDQDAVKMKPHYEGQLRYAENLAASKFFLCPRGAGCSSIRLFEVMQLAVAPVIIADGWIPPDHTDWSFALFIPERQLHQVDQIIRSHQDEWRERGAAAREAYLKFYSLTAAPAVVFQDIRRLLTQYSEGRERCVHFIYPALGGPHWLKLRLRKLLKWITLQTFVLLRLKFPYELNRPVEEQLKRK